MPLIDVSGRIIDFPDSMSEQDILRAINEVVLPQMQQHEAKTGLMPAVKAAGYEGLGNLNVGLGALADVVGMKGVAQGRRAAGEEYRKRGEELAEPITEADVLAAEAENGPLAKMAMQAKQHVLQPAAGMVGRFAPTLGLMAIPGVGMPAAFANEYLASAGEDITKYGATPERALAYAAPQAALNTMTRLPFGGGAMLAEKLGLAGTEAATRGVTEAAAAARQRAEEEALASGIVGPQTERAMAEQALAREQAGIEAAQAAADALPAARTGLGSLGQYGRDVLSNAAVNIPTMVAGDVLGRMAGEKDITGHNAIEAYKEMALTGGLMAPLFGGIHTMMHDPVAARAQAAQAAAAAEQVRPEHADARLKLADIEEQERENQERDEINNTPFHPRRGPGQMWEDLRTSTGRTDAPEWTSLSTEQQEAFSDALQARKPVKETEKGYEPTSNTVSAFRTLAPITDATRIQRAADLYAAHKPADAIDFAAHSPEMQTALIEALAPVKKNNTFKPVDETKLSDIITQTITPAAEPTVKTRAARPAAEPVATPEERMAAAEAAYNAHVLPHRAHQEEFADLDLPQQQRIANIAAPKGKRVSAFPAVDKTHFGDVVKALDALKTQRDARAKREQDIEARKTTRAQTAADRQATQAQAAEAEAAQKTPEAQYTNLRKADKGHPEFEKLDPAAVTKLQALIDELPAARKGKLKNPEIAEVVAEHYRARPEELTAWHYDQQRRPRALRYAELNEAGRQQAAYEMRTKGAGYGALDTITSAGAVRIEESHKKNKPVYVEEQERARAEQKPKAAQSHGDGRPRPEKGETTQGAAGSGAGVRESRPKEEAEEIASARWASAEEHHGGIPYAELSPAQKAVLSDPAKLEAYGGITKFAQDVRAELRPETHAPVVADEPPAATTTVTKRGKPSTAAQLEATKLELAVHNKRLQEVVDTHNADPNNYPVTLQAVQNASEDYKQLVAKRDRLVAKLKQEKQAQQKARPADDQIRSLETKLATLKGINTDGAYDTQIAKYESELAALRGQIPAETGVTPAETVVAKDETTTPAETEVTPAETVAAKTPPAPAAETTTKLRTQEQLHAAHAEATAALEQAEAKHASVKADKSKAKWAAEIQKHRETIDALNEELESRGLEPAPVGKKPDEPAEEPVEDVISQSEQEYQDAVDRAVNDPSIANITEMVQADPIQTARNTLDHVLDAEDLGSPEKAAYIRAEAQYNLANIKYKRAAAKDKKQLKSELDTAKATLEAAKNSWLDALVEQATNTPTRENIRDLSGVLGTPRLKKHRDPLNSAEDWLYTVHSPGYEYERTTAGKAHYLEWDRAEALDKVVGALVDAHPSFAPLKRIRTATEAASKAAEESALQLDDEKKKPPPSKPITEADLSSLEDDLEDDLGDTGGYYSKEDREQYKKALGKVLAAAKEQYNRVKNDPVALDKFYADRMQAALDYTGNTGKLVYQNGRYGLVRGRTMLLNREHAHKYAPIHIRDNMTVSTPDFAGHVTDIRDPLSKRTFIPDDIHAELADAADRHEQQIKGSTADDAPVNKPIDPKYYKDNSALADATDTGDIGAVLDVLGKSDNPLYRQIAEKARSIPNLGVKTHKSTRVGGMYAVDVNKDTAEYRHNISMSEQYKDSEPVWAHELTHAILKHAIDSPTKAQKKYVDALKKLYDHVKAHETASVAIQGIWGLGKRSSTMEYALKDIHEFVSEGLSSQEFQAYLHRIEYQNTSMWHKFVSAIANIMGIRNHTALSELINNTAKLMDTEWTPPTKSSKARLEVSSATKTILDSDYTKMRGDEPATVKRPWFDDFVAKYVDKGYHLTKALAQHLPEQVGGVLRADLLGRAHSQIWNVINMGRRTGAPELMKDGTIAVREIPFTLRSGRKVNASMAEMQRLADKVPDGRKLFSEVAYILDAAAQLRRDPSKVGKNITDDMETFHRRHAAALKALNEHPEIKDALDMWREINKNLIDYAFRTGLIDSKTKALFMSEPHYMPRYALREEVMSAMGAEDERGRRGGYTVSNQYVKTFRERTASEHQTNAWENMARHYASVTLGGANNVFKRAAAEQLASVQEQVTQQSAKIKKGEKGGNFAVLEDGKRVRYTLDDPAIIPAMMAIQQELGPLAKAGRTATRALRATVLNTPAYWARQIIRDPIYASFVSDVGWVTPFNTMKELATIREGRSPEYDLLVRRGVVSHVDPIMTPADTSAFAQDIGRPKKDRTLAGKVTGKFGHSLENVHAAIDGATRVAIYKAAFKKAIKEGKRGEDAINYAVHKARESLNFSVRGSETSMETARALVPFLSATIQGLDTFRRAAMGTNVPASERAAARRSFAAKAATVGLLTSGYTLMMMSNEDYTDYADQHAKFGNILVPTGDERHKFIQMPIAPEVAVFKWVPEMLINALAGNMTGAQMIDATLSEMGALTPSLIPQAVRPLMEAVANYSFHTGRPIESIGEQTKSVRERGAHASEGAKELADNPVAEYFKASPAKIDHVARGYFGDVGIAALSLVGSMFSDTPDKPVDLMKLPIVGAGSFASPAYASKARDDFYNQRAEADQARADYNRALETNPESAKVKEWQHDPEFMQKVQMAKVYDKQARQLSTLYKQIEMIENSKYASEAEKEKRIEEKRIQINQLAKMFVKKEAA